MRRNRPFGTPSGRSTKRKKNEDAEKKASLKAPTKAEINQFDERLTVNQRMFLAAYVNLGSVLHAALAVKMVRQNHRRWMKEENYRKAFKQAQKVAIEILEGSVHQSAIAGNIAAACFRLKGLKPEMYRDGPRILVNNVPQDQPKHTGINLEELPADLRAKLLEFIRRREEPKVN